MKISLIVAFILLCGTRAFAEAEIRLVAVGVAMKDAQMPDSAVTVKDGFAVSVMVFNDSTGLITLPSKLLQREIVEQDDAVLILFTYFPRTFTSKSGSRRIIPSREAFAPVTLQPGECMQLEPTRFAVERKDTQSKRVIYSLRTKGFLSDRMGFTGVELNSELIVQNMEVSPDRRDP